VADLLTATSRREVGHPTRHPGEKEERRFPPRKRMFIKKKASQSPLPSYREKRRGGKAIVFFPEKG